MPEMSASVSSSILVVENPSPTFSSFYSICCCCFGGFKLDRLFDLLGRVTAIDRKNLSGSERCAGGTEPDHDAGDLFRLADAADGSRGFQHLLYFRRPRHEVAIHSRLDRPGRDGIDSNVLFGVFQRDRFGQPVDGVLAGNVDRNRGTPISPAMEELLTMAPPPVFSIAGISCFSDNQTPLTLMSMIWS